MKKLVLLILGLSILFSFPARADITIGVAGPMTGSVASFGEDMKRGIQIAAGNINQSGGLLGQAIHLSVHDDGCEPKQAVSIANLLVTEKASLAIGHICSGSTLPATDVYEENETLLMMPLAMLNEITARGHRHIFRMAANNSDFGAFIGGFIQKELKPKKMVIVAGKLAITQETGKKTQEKLKQGGIESSFYDFNNGENDYSALVSRIKADNPDVIFCACYPKEGGLIIRQAREAGITAKIVGYVTMSSVDILNVAGKYSDGIIVTDYRFPENNAAYQQLIKMLADKKWPPESATFLGYASIQVFSQAVRKASSLETAKILPILRNTEFDTVIGKIRFDGKGDMINPQLQMKVWQSGKLVPFKTQ